MLSEKNQLNESFHEGKEDTPRRMVNDIKLEKLGNIGRREIAMSILPEEFEEF